MRHPWIDYFGHSHAMLFDPPAGDGGGAGGGTGDPPTPPAGDPPRTYSQEEFDKAAKGIRLAAEREAARKLAEQLGCTPEEAKAALDKRKADEDARLTEVEKRERAAEERERKADAATAAANATQRRAAVALALTGAGVKAERVNRAVATVLDDLSGDDQADEAAITAAVTKVKEELPEFFGAGGAPPPPAPTPGGAPRNNGSSGGESAFEAGRKFGEEQAKGAKPANPLSQFEGMRPMGQPASPIGV